MSCTITRNGHILRQMLLWGTIEGILYQLILVVHNIFLFKVVDLAVYGQAGLIFSIAYGFSYCTTTGFDIFYAHGQDHKSSLIVIQLLWIGFFCVVTFLGHFFIYIPWIALALGVAEALKRSLKIITITNHRFIRVTGLELLHITLYCSIIWTGCFFGYALTIPLLIVPLIISTLYCTLHYAYYLTISWQWPDNLVPLLHHRMLLFTGTVYHILFSGNTMTYLTYTTLGPVYAAGIKLASTCTHGIISIMERVLTTGATLLCTPKNNLLLYQSLGNYVWLASLFGSIISGSLVSYTFWKQNCSFLLPYAGLYIILHIAGIVAVLCERVFLAESPHKAPALTIISGISIGIALMVGTYTVYPVSGIVLFVIIRILLSICLGIQASRRIDPHYFTIMSHNLLVLFCALFLCVFFMRQ